MEASEFGPELGFFGAVAAHGLGARRHMHEYGTTRAHFGAIAIAFREHALRNPDALAFVLDAGGVTLAELVGDLLALEYLAGKEECES